MLLIDSGNSAIKCRLIESSEPVDRVFSSRPDSDQKDFCTYLKALPRCDVYLASVAGADIRQRIIALIQQQPGLKLTQLFTLAELGGFKNGYHDYRQLGVDRWLTLLAADALSEHDAVIVDAGSAITIDLLSKQKGHLGGAILRGFNTDYERFRQIFPAIDFSHAEIADSALPGRSTRQCLQMQQQSLTPVDIGQLIKRWLYLLHAPVSVILCGQDAAGIARALDLPCQQVTDLVFRGMLKQIQLTA